MKAKSNYKDKKFEPIDVTITIEDENELIELYARANISLSSLNDVSYKNKPINYTVCTPLFNELDRICRKHFG